MGQVTMDLAELDSIREELKEAKFIIEQKNEALLNKDKEIAEVQAEKRTVKIIERQELEKPAEDYYFNPNGRHGMNYHTNDPKIEDLARDVYSIFERMFARGRIDKYEVLSPLASCLQKHGYQSNKSQKFKTVREVQYINFDDVIVDLQAKLEKNLSVQIADYRKKISDLEEKVSTSDISKETEIKKITEKFQKDLDKEVENFEKDREQALKDYKKLQKEFDDFREEKDTRTLMQKIRDLERELEEERSRKWWQNRKKK